MSLTYKHKKANHLHLINYQCMVDHLIENKEKLLFIGAVYGQDLSIEEIAGAKAIIQDICFNLDEILNTMAS